MLGVTIYEVQNGKDTVVGTIQLVDGHLETKPADDPLLQEILKTPVRGNKFNPRPVSASSNPVQFLNNLRYHYRSPYLRASAPTEM